MNSDGVFGCHRKPMIRNDILKSSDTAELSQNSLDDNIGAQSSY